MKKKPTVSIITITYNQEAFVRETLESLVGQTANFDLEILISDDNSTDKTPDIIAEFANEYPTIVKPTLRQKNMGSMQNFVETLKRAQGKYIAICEGDDYWTDSTKLQRQVDFMEANKDYSISFHPVRVVFENGEEEDSIYPPDSKGFTLERLLQGNFIQTNSVVYRRQDYESLVPSVVPGDWYLHLYHAQFGKIGFIDRVMSVYRRHAAGLWWDSASNSDAFWEKHSLGHFGLYNEIYKMYGDNEKYKRAIESSIVSICSRTLELDERRNTSIMGQAVKRYPDIALVYLKAQRDTLTQTNKELQDASASSHELRMEKGKIIEEYEHQLQAIRVSKSFKVGAAVMHPQSIPRLLTKKVTNKKR